MINVTNRSCTGCRACELICPKGCISLTEDAEGFLVAKANPEECIQCGKCEKICPQNHDWRQETKTQKAYAVTLLDKGPLQRSSSGGAFYALAISIIDRGGSVYGAAFGPGWMVHTIRVNNHERLGELQGSKYVQCDPVDSYKQVTEDLAAGKWVMYSGTPCMIAGLKAYLNEKKNNTNLITVDLVCHGVPSPLLFQKYVGWLERNGRKLDDYRFRSKRYGWGHSTSFRYRGSKSKHVSSEDPYNKCFYSNVIFRECCYECKYSCRERCGDVTICDFWGIQSEKPDFYCKEGVSGVIANNEKGENLLIEATRYAKVHPCDLQAIIRHNHNLSHPSERPKQRDWIYQGIESLKAEEFIEKQLTPFVTLKDIIQALIPFSIKYFVKRIMRGF